MEKITCSKNNGKELQFNCAQYREAGGPERGNYAMTREEAERYIAQLTFEEKLKLNELLKALEQKRQLFPSHPASTGTSGL